MKLIESLGWRAFLLCGVYVCLPRRTGVKGGWEWQVGRVYGGWLWHERRIKNFRVAREDR